MTEETMDLIGDLLDEAVKAYNKGDNTLYANMRRFVICIIRLQLSVSNVKS
jgi:hypothetical protein